MERRPPARIGVGERDGEKVATTDRGWTRDMDRMVEGFGLDERDGEMAAGANRGGQKRWREGHHHRSGWMREMEKRAERIGVDERDGEKVDAAQGGQEGLSGEGGFIISQ